MKRNIIMGAVVLAASLRLLDPGASPSSVASASHRGGAVRATRGGVGVYRGGYYGGYRGGFGGYRGGYYRGGYPGYYGYGTGFGIGLGTGLLLGNTYGGYARY